MIRNQQTLHLGRIPRALRRVALVTTALLLAWYAVPPFVIVARSRGGIVVATYFLVVALFPYAAFTRAPAIANRVYRGILLALGLAILALYYWR